MSKHTPKQTSEQSLQETYAPGSACFGCGPANEAGLHVRGIAGECPLQVFGRLRVLGVIGQHHAHAVVRTRMVRCNRQCLRKRGLGFCPIASTLMNDAEQERQFDRSGCQLDPVFDHRDGLLDASR